ncbi:acyl-CoA thioester hydrolase/BAAT C-terminal domain-containing protein [Rhodococcus aetherivorans]|nr:MULTISPECIES: acyl-CoA thioester hydrolase/BAAT C-terminal domain-containing protein [Rhodococcus]USC17221.1 acyl-CoA thioesterase [Rhodococcus sp. 11-3]WKX00512.1 acyl-CoA thioester hydrolase/BAAT C-terminal domain-containing protein [Rhodococcus aetherivorans]
MSLVVGFAPWIVYWILVGNTGFVTAVAAALALAAAGPLVQRVRGKPWRSLDVGTVVVFALLLIAALTLDDAVLERWLQPVGNLGLLLVVLGGILAGRPFVREYAVETVDPATAASGGFRYITTAMTWMWAAAFAVMTVSSLIPPIVDGSATVRDETDALSVVGYWVVPFVVLGAAGLVSALFPKWFDTKSALAATANPSPEPASPTAPPPDLDSPRVHLVVPRQSRHDEPFRLTLAGSRPDATITVTAEGADMSGARWRSHRSYDGSVDVVDEPLWDMRFDEPDRVPDLFVPPPGRWPVTLTVTDGPHTTRRTVIRTDAAPGVTVENLDVAGRPGLLARPDGPAPLRGWPAVLCVGGSEGGVDSQRATIAALASHGHVALAYSWLDENTEVASVPLERFTGALRHLAALPEIDTDNVAAVGISRGAEGLLAAVAADGTSLRALVLVSPSSVSWQGLGPDGEIPDTPSWTLGGAPQPWAPLPSSALMPQMIRNAWRAGRDVARHRPSLLRLSDAYRAGLRDAPDPAHLRSEKIDAPILCITGTDDQLWPATDMAGALLARRGDGRDRHLSVDGAGHLIRLGMFPGDAQWSGGIAFGGTPAGQGRAQRAAVDAVTEFLA